MAEAQHRKQVPNEHIFRFVCFESAACNSHADPRSRNGRSAVAVAEDVPARPVSARATLYARSGSEMAGEARTREKAVELGRGLAAIERQGVTSQNDAMRRGQPSMGVSLPAFRAHSRFACRNRDAFKSH